MDETKLVAKMLFDVVVETLMEEMKDEKRVAQIMLNISNRFGAKTEDMMMLIETNINNLRNKK